MAKRLWELFYTFAKVGVMTFGGGYAMLPILQREVVENKGWATEEELADWFAIGQCTPGVIAVNTATFAGRKVLGNIGGVVATLGVVFPSLIIISLLAGVITTFAEVAWVRNAFAGIRVCVCVLIFNAVVKLWKKSVVDKKTLALYAVILLASLLTDLSPVIFVLFAAVSAAIRLNADPEQALHAACEKFISRFTAMEQTALAEGRPLETLSKDELLAGWNAQKRVVPGGEQ